MKVWSAMHEVEDQQAREINWGFLPLDRHRME
jgi:hypothetical protein